MHCERPLFVETKKWLRDPDTGKIVSSVPVGCGDCLYCRTRRIREWSFRLQQENKVSESAMFLTLTYDTLNVPITEKGFMTLRKKDLQDFMKRLRYYHEESRKKRELPKGLSSDLWTWRPIKYYGVGEYGDRRKRSHYHLLVFNAYYPHVTLAWQFGEIYKGDVEDASIAYTLKYMQKEEQWWRGNWFDGESQFSVSSKHLGKNYLDEKIISWHNSDLSKHYSPKGNYKVPLSRYYREKIYDSQKLEELRLHIAREVDKLQAKEVQKFHRSRLASFMEYTEWKDMVLRAKKNKVKHGNRTKD